MNCETIDKVMSTTRLAIAEAFAHAAAHQQARRHDLRADPPPPAQPLTASRTQTNQVKAASDRPRAPGIRTCSRGR